MNGTEFRGDGERCLGSLGRFALLGYVCKWN